MKLQITCCLCGSHQIRFRFEKKGKSFWRCGSCGLEMQHPLPTEADLQDYYDSSYQDGLYTEFAAATLMKEITARRRFDELIPQASGHRWLDVGAANGTFVKYLIGRGKEASGIEISETAARQAQAEGIPVQHGTLEDYESAQSCDVVCAFDILEHTLDPVVFMKQIHTTLKPRGYVVLTTPDLNSIQRILMGSRWYFYIPEEHLYYFNRKTIRLLLEKTGFNSVSISRTFKPLTYEYALTQFREYNPLIYKILSAVGFLLPRRLQQAAIPIYIGEMMVIAQRNE